jgi:hypothetical protein
LPLTNSVVQAVSTTHNAYQRRERSSRAGIVVLYRVLSPIDKHRIESLCSQTCRVRRPDFLIHWPGQSQILRDFLNSDSRVEIPVRSAEVALLGGFIGRTSWSCQSPFLSSQFAKKDRIIEVSVFLQEASLASSEAKHICRVASRCCHCA